MSEITDLGSPDRELSARDINRKTNKLNRINKKLENAPAGTRRRHNLEFKKEKTVDQITTGKSGIRPVKKPFKVSHHYDLRQEKKFNEGISRKKSALNMVGVKASPLNDMTKQENDAEMNKFLSNIHTIDNPEYASYTKKLNPDSEVFGKYSPEAEAVRSTEHDYFVKNRNKDSDATAKEIIALNTEFDLAHKAKDFGAKREIMAKQKKIRDKIKFNVENYSASEYLDRVMNDKRFKK